MLVLAEYATVTKKQIAHADSGEYVQVLCQENATSGEVAVSLGTGVKASTNCICTKTPCP